jgi:hypothetical protein
MSPTGTPIAPAMAVSGSGHVSTGPSPASTIGSSAGSNASSVPTTPGSPNADSGMYSFGRFLPRCLCPISDSCVDLSLRPSTCSPKFPTFLVHSWYLSSSPMHIALHSSHSPTVLAAGASALHHCTLLFIVALLLFLQLVPRSHSPTQSARRRVQFPTLSHLAPQLPLAPHFVLRRVKFPTVVTDSWFLSPPLVRTGFSLVTLLELAPQAQFLVAINLNSILLRTSWVLNRQQCALEVQKKFTHTKTFDNSIPSRDFQDPSLLPPPSPRTPRKSLNERVCARRLLAQPLNISVRRFTRRRLTGDQAAGLYISRLPYSLANLTLALAPELTYEARHHVLPILHDSVYIEAWRHYFNVRGIIFGFCGI